MKYVALIAMLSIASTTNAALLEDGFKVDPKLEKPMGNEYEEKQIPEGKIFKKNSEDKFKLAKEKESVDKHEIYQLKMEKKNGKLEKIEKIVEMDKTEKGKAKSMFKCGAGGTDSQGNMYKGGCQAFTPGFCKKLLDNEKFEDKIREKGSETAAVQFYKDLYKSEDAYEPKSEQIAKLRDLNQSARNDAGEQPKLKEMVEKIQPVYPAPNIAFGKGKINQDIQECKELGGIWVKPKPNQLEPGTSPAQKTASSAQ